MEQVSTRLAKEDIERLTEFEADTGATRAEALRRLIRMGLEDWQQERALERLREGSVTLRQAADIAGVSYVDMLSAASAAGIDIGYTRDELNRDLKQ